MDCKDMQKYIGAFLKDKLEDDVAEAFMQHVYECSECMEELTMQYLVTEGLQRLETGSAFDVQKELQDKIERAIEKRKLHKRIKTGLFAAGALCTMALIIVISFFL